MTPEEFRAAGHRLIDWIADYRAGVESRPVMAQTQPGDIKSKLPTSPPQRPESFDSIFADSSLAMPVKYQQIISYVRSVGLRPVQRLISRQAMIAQ